MCRLTLNFPFFRKDGMDHRTLKTRENSASQKDLSFHYQHMSSLQSIMNTLDGSLISLEFCKQCVFCGYCLDFR